MSYNVKTGTLKTAADTVSIGLQGDTNLTYFLFSGTYGSAVIIIEATLDGTNWFTVNFSNAKTSEAYSLKYSLVDNSSTAVYTVNFVYSSLRVRLVSISSGTVTVTAIQSKGFVGTLEEAFVVASNTNVAKLSASVAAGGSTADLPVVTSGPGILHRFIVTTVGSAACSIYDDPAVSSGKPLLYTSGTTTPAVGTVTELNVPFAKGITIAQASGSFAGTLFYTLL